MIAKTSWPKGEEDDAPPVAAANDADPVAVFMDEIVVFAA